MPVMKRRNSDAILPLRAPKQPKTTANHPLGGNSSPSQYEALLSRWVKLGKEVMHTLQDTISVLIHAGRDTQDTPLPSPPLPVEDGYASGAIPSPPPTPPPAPPPRASTSTHRLPARQPIPTFSADPTASKRSSQLSTSAPAAPGIHQRVRSAQPNGDISLPPSHPAKYVNAHANAVASTSKNTLQTREDPKVSGFPGGANSTGLMSPPSTQASESSILSTRNAVTQRYPEVGAALQEHDRQRRRKVSTKKYIQREHIHAKQHKVRVQEENKRTREEMEKDLKELYHIKRSAGYRSDFESFRSLLDYEARLEKLDKTGALSPSASLMDLRSRAKQDENRRHSYPDHIDPEFLQRAIQKAQDALKAPRPPKPFVPTLEQLRLNHLRIDEEIEDRLRPKRRPLPTSLPPEDEAAVDALFRQRGIIAKCAKEQVSNEDIMRLRPAQWLNDEIINFYGQMIVSRSEDSKENPGHGIANGRKKPLNSHYFSTFFWAKLKGQGYEKARLAKWTKKIDIFSKDVILIPVNHNNAHWTAAAINFRKKRIESYDSMGMDRGQVFKVLRQYLDEEHRNKKKKPFDFTGWEDYTLAETPQQENGYDCGVFTCQFLESLSRGEEEFGFTQDNMSYLRRKMVWEIGHVKLRDEP